MIIVLVSAIVILVALGLFTQVVIPLSENRKMFPIFRTNELRDEVQALENETEDLEHKVTALEIVTKLKKRKQELEDSLAKYEKLAESENNEGK